MDVDEGRDQVEEYMCAMPRYYAVPLVLLNKRLAFVEASCHPDGTPLSLPPSHPPPTAINTNTDDDDDHGDSGSGEDGRGVAMVTQDDLREYSYLYRLRTQFLQAILDMNHERRLDERWRYSPIHGFLHRLYRRYGHDVDQRAAYWRDEIKAARVPYATPDIADMGMCVLARSRPRPLLHAIHPPSAPLVPMKQLCMKKLGPRPVGARTVSFTPREGRKMNRNQLP